MATSISAVHAPTYLNHPLSNHSSTNNPLFALRHQNRVAFRSSIATASSSKWTTNNNRSNYRHLPALIRASKEKSSEISIQNDSSSLQTSSEDRQQLLHHFSLRMILEIITFIWRLPSFIGDFLKKEEKFMDTVEEDITETATVIKVGSKLVEEVAEGLEDVAQGLEKAAKTLDTDAEEVDAIMDKVIEKTKTAHDELQEVVETLQRPVQGARKDAPKVEVQVTGSKEDEIGSASIRKEDPPSLATGDIQNRNNFHASLAKTLVLTPTPKSLLHNSSKLLQRTFSHANFSLPSSLISLPTLVLRTSMMVSLLLVLFGMTTSPLVIHGF